MRLRAQDLFMRTRFQIAFLALAISLSPLNLLVTGGSGFIGSNLVLELQTEFPKARLTVIDDFRSGDFKNLAGYKGDFIAKIWRRWIGKNSSGMKNSTAFFISPPSPTPRITTSSNRCTITWRAFAGSCGSRRLNKTRVVFASSAST